MATFLVRLRDLWQRLTGTVVGEPTPGTGAPPATPVDHAALTTATVDEVRTWINDHDDGRFEQSALLSDLTRRDADLFGALQQRLLPMGGHPLLVDPPEGDDSTHAAEGAAAIRRDFRRVVTVAAQNDLLSDAVLLGFAVAQLVWRWDEASGKLLPALLPWPAASVEYRRWERRWYVHTRDQGPVPITPGDGQWVLFAPRSVRAPHLWGVLRCTAEWYLRASYAAADASRHAEVHGIPVWKAMLPSGARQTPDGKAFARSIRTMGRNAVVPCPRGADEASSYDVELIEAKTDAYRIFEFLLTAGGGRMRLAILGQDLTSQNNRVGTNASSETGADVTATIIQADAAALSLALTEQVARPWARYLGVPAPLVRIDAEPEEDRKAEADAMIAAADAATRWQALGVAVDVEALARRARVPILAGGARPPPPPGAP